MLALHAARDVGPSHFAIGEAALTRLEHFDVVRRSEPAGAEKSQEVVEAQRRILCALFQRRQRPGVHFHVIGRYRIEGANRDRHDVVDYEIGKNAEIATRLADAPRPLGTKALVESAPQFLEMRFAMLTERRHPVRNRSSPSALILHNRMAIA